MLFRLLPLGFVACFRWEKQKQSGKKANNLWQIMKKQISILFLILSLLGAEIGHCAQLDTMKLSGVILDQFKNDCTNIDVTTWAGYIADQCKSAANNGALVAAFDPLFQNDGNLKGLMNYSANRAELVKVESDIANVIFPPAAAVSNSAGSLLKNIASHLDDCEGIGNVREYVDQWSGYIASQCAGANDYTSLQTELVKLFSSDGNLTWLQYAKNRVVLADAAARIADEAYPSTKSDGDSVNLLSDVTVDNHSNVWAQVSVWTGAKFSTPYNISGNKLSTAGNTSDGYIELNLSSRYVLRQGQKASDIVWGDWGTLTPHDGQMHFVNPLAHMPDIDTRIGYLFRGSSAPTNYNASTIVGSSDFYADTSLGFPLWRY